MRGAPHAAIQDSVLSIPESSFRSFPTHVPYNTYCTSTKDRETMYCFSSSKKGIVVSLLLSLLQSSWSLSPKVGVAAAAAKQASWLVSSTEVVATTCAALVIMGHACTAIAAVDFDFSNGHVRIEEPLTIVQQDKSSKAPPLRLVHPELIGYGGGGAVFKFDNEMNNNSNVAASSSTPVLVKISWLSSANAVRKECQVLQYLQSNSVAHTETCWATLAYPHDDQHRVMIVLTPYVPLAVAAVGDLASPALERTAVQDICEFCVQMLAHGVITIDVQPLIDPTTGHVTFIDLTEAQILSSLSNGDTADATDATLVASFCTEIRALIPEQWTAWASKVVQDEMQRTVFLSPTVEDIASSILMSD